MNTWQLIQELMRGVSFYWKKFFIFSFLVVILGSSFIYVQHQKSQAALSFSNEQQFSEVASQNYDINVTSSGKVTVNGKDASNDLKIYPNFYEIQVMLADSSGSFFDNITARMSLPKDITQTPDTQRIYAVHGVGPYSAYMENPHTLVYTASEVSSTATLSIVAQLPKNTLTPPLTKRIYYYFSNVPADQYTFFAGILPIITLIIVLFMVVKRRRDQIIIFQGDILDRPPAKIPPAIAGVLIDGQVGSREIAATLIDLANRGYIYIIERSDYFTFGKRKTLNLDDLPELRPFERILLEKIFEKKDYKSTKDDVEMRVGHHIFSRKIANVFLEIYNEATSLGYFIKNPAVIHRRWRYTGITLFFLGILGFIQSAAYAPDPKFTLIFWVGEIAAASVIIRFSGLMPSRSRGGSQALTQWMSFRRYLKQKEKIPGGAAIDNKFNKYLPYAIVFGVEVEWAKRFFKTSFAKPDWYESIDYITSLDKYINGLYPLISFVGQILANSHEPTVE